LYHAKRVEHDQLLSSVILFLEGHLLVMIDKFKKMLDDVHQLVQEEVGEHRNFSSK
jgi:hypothetical protein